MSITTPAEWRKLFLYQVYLRSHTPSGTISEFVNDLDRIRDLGVDMIYFMPIHPIGKVKRKGSLGCPYSISDYRAVNPEYGTIDDFRNAVKAIHDRGMTVMIDVVYNHTSHDSKLLHDHPEYFLHKDGKLFSKEPHWSDVQDLDYEAGQPLWDELVDTLLFWMKQGVDGFRFDVASFLPLAFLEYAGEKMRALKADVVLLSESVHGGYLRHMRNRGFNIISESEIYQVFDMAYDYDLHPYFEGYMAGRLPLNTYLRELLRQEEIYPQNYIKMRNLENHDQKRIAHLLKEDPGKIDNWTAFNFLLKGSTMIYAGQECSATHQPSLFEKEPVNWNGRDLSPLIKKLATIAKYDHLAYGAFDIKLQDKEVICVTYDYNGETLVGVFNIGLEQGVIDLELPSKTYQNLLDDTVLTVSNGKLKLVNEPLVFIVS